MTTLDQIIGCSGRVTTALTPRGAIHYAYDANGNVTQLSESGYGTVNYAYDELDRLSSVTKDGQTYRYGYDPLGRRTGLDRPNGVTTSYEYDAGNRLTALTHNKGTTVLERHDYQYDASGNIVKYVRGKGSSQPVTPKPCGKNGKARIRQVMGYIADKAEEIERTYAYDALDRLTAVNGLGMVASASRFKSPGNKLAAAMLIEQARRVSNPQMRNPFLRNAERLGAVLPESAGWSFDENGNIAKKTLKTTDGERQITYSYDEADRLVSLTRPQEEANGDRPCPFHWRHHGRGKAAAPAAKTETVTLDYDANGNLTGDSTGRTFTWNAQDQLVRLQTPDATAAFAYDPLGRRVSFSRGSQSRAYLYDGLNALTDGTSRFLHGAGVDEPLQVDSASSSESLLQDHLGSTSQLLDSASGTSKSRYDYKSYGKLEGDIDNRSLTNPYTYTGREDDGTGLMYYRARYYDPELEVFISQDPLGDAQRYVDGNPLGFVDPMGLDAWGDANNFITGFGDTGSFGISRYIREHYGNGQTYLGRKPDPCSQSYSAGGVTVTAASLVTGGAGIVKGVFQRVVAKEGALIAGQSLNVGFKTAHYAARLEAEGLNVAQVESTIAKQVASGSLSGRLTINGVLVEYRAFKLPNGNINIGTIFPVRW